MTDTIPAALRLVLDNDGVNALLNDAQAVHEHQTQQAVRAWLTGEILLRWKQRLNVVTWGLVLREVFKISPATAQNYINLNTAFSLEQVQSGRLLLAAMYDLSTASTPQPAREAVMVLATAGVTLARDQARTLRDNPDTADAIAQGRLSPQAAGPYLSHLALLNDTVRQSVTDWQVLDYDVLHILAGQQKRGGETWQELAATDGFISDGGEQLHISQVSAPHLKRILAERQRKHISDNLSSRYQEATFTALVKIENGRALIELPAEGLAEGQAVVIVRQDRGA